MLSHLEEMHDYIIYEKKLKTVRDNNPDGPYKKILRDKGITLFDLDELK